MACAAALTVGGAAVAQPGPHTPRAAPARDDARHAALAGSRLILPLLATAGTSTYGKLSTVVEVANVSDTEARYTARLLGGGGSPSSLLVETASYVLQPVSSMDETLAANDGQRFVFLPRTDGPSADPLRIVWAEFIAAPADALSVSAVLRAEASNGTVRRAEISPGSLYRRAWLHTDNTAGSATSLVLINPDTDARTFALRFRGFAGASSNCETSVRVPTLGQAIVETGESLACSAGGRGLTEIRGPGRFAGIGLVSGGAGGLLARELAGQPPEQHPTLSQWSVAPGLVGFGSALGGGCVTLADTHVGDTAYTVHSSKWQRRSHSGDEWTDVPGTARSGQLCPYDPSDPGEYRAVADITVSEERGTFASSDILRVEDGPAPLPPPLPGLEEFTNSVGMQFIKIPAGEFSMGATGAWAYGGELPVTRVRISEAFWIGMHEVTQGQWQAVMGGNPSTFPNCGADCPVESVSWNDVQRFVARLNEREGEASYRLPTEAEWEYAARAGAETDTYAGDLTVHGSYDAPLLDRIAWYGGNRGVDYEGGRDCSGWPGKKQYASSRCGPHPVGRKAPNRFALHDVLGNVREWVQDWHGDYPGGAATDPAGPESGSHRVARGGGWFNRALSARSAGRSWAEPDRRFTNYGLRLVRMDSGDPTTGSPDPAADEYAPLDEWTVSDGRVQFFFSSAGGCISIGNTTLNGVTYTVHNSHWQRRTDAGRAWTDIPGTQRTGSLCPYSPDGPGQYRGVAEISIDGERGNYSTRNILTVEGASQPQTVEIALGTSGEVVTLSTAEDGPFWLGDTLFNSGDTVAASNGSEYVLTLEDGAWTAAYVSVETVVALGAWAKP